jgi:hypothetical protein
MADEVRTRDGSQGQPCEGCCGFEDESRSRSIHCPSGNELGPSTLGSVCVEGRGDGIWIKSAVAAEAERLSGREGESGEITVDYKGMTVMSLRDDDPKIKRRS